MKRKIMWLIVVLVALWIMFLMTGCVTINPRPWTQGEKTVLAWSVVAVTADMFTTCNALNNSNNYETNPMLGMHPTNEQVIIHLSMSNIILTAISHWVPEIELPIVGKINLRYGLLGSKAVMNTYFAINNAALDW